MKQILFNTEMVKAILDWRKTATRRLPSKRIRDKWFEYDEWVNAVSFTGCSRLSEKEFYEQYPPCRIGDVLYVKETWFYSSCANCGGDIADGVCSKRESGEEPTGCYFYKADNNNFEWDDKRTHWRPSIHMPKEAARIFLKVTDVRVERLQDIYASDTSKEGILFNKPHTSDEMCKAFSELWDSTIEKKDLPLYGWKANPYVWVIEFERC